MHLNNFPRVRLGHFPTPLEPMPRLSKALGGPELWIKRDDCTGMSTGGNKTRKLEFLFAEALSKNADIVLTQGATQSNHARQTAAFAAKLGLKCHLLLEDRVRDAEEHYYRSGNVFLDYLHGASAESRPIGLDMNAELEQAAKAFNAQGHQSYAIPGGGSNEIGALGYVSCVTELVYQCQAQGVYFDHFVHATGSAGTQAGLAVGFALHNLKTRLLGVGVRAPKEKQEDMVFALANKTANKIGYPSLVKKQDILANCDYVGQGYGLPTDACIEAIEMFARYEGILLDPVYSGKGAAGLIDLVRKNEYSKNDKVVFLHTGGNVALFGYTDAFTYKTKALLQKASG